MGYVGYSMSENAVEAYDNGEMPMSSWRKKDILSSNPYETPSFCNVNLREMARYARAQDKKLVELTAEEVDKFKR